MAGKNSTEHIVTINQLFYEAVVKDDSRVLFLLDTAKAFDSIDHEWVHHVLRQTGLPLWLRNFVKGSLHGVKVAPVFGGDLSDWIDILRGVKQGCPLSPLLFIIAYDPLLYHLKHLLEIRSFAYADDLALFCSSVRAIFLALELVDVFSLVSGLGVNKDKSAADPTGPTDTWPGIQSTLAKGPWKDLTVKARATLGHSCWSWCHFGGSVGGAR